MTQSLLQKPAMALEMRVSSRPAGAVAPQAFSAARPCSHRASRQCRGSAPSQAQAVQRRCTLVRCVAATEVTQSASSSSTQGETYELFLQKPIGIRFARGNDGAAYVLKTDPRLGSTDSRVQEGDKIVSVSASFGEEVWEAKNFGQVMYAIRTRAGEVYLKLEDRGGDMSCFEEEEMTEAERQFKEERASATIGWGTKEMQERNYKEKRQLERRRRELFDDALDKFKKKDLEGALINFENVLSLEPKNFLSDNFSRVTQIYRVTQYNIACCYSTMGNMEAGLEALDASMAAGFEDYGKVRSDPNLAALRKSPKFAAVINKYDEPIINENAMKALKSIFSFGKKQE